MLNMQILENNDQVAPTDWVRPLYLFSDGGEICTRSVYGGRPINNLRWIRVYAYFAPCWHNQTVVEICERLGPHEFLRGNVPTTHRHPEQTPVPGYVP